jgi:hypothetical protein
MSDAPEFTIFMQVKTKPEWLALPPPRRFAFFLEEVLPILARQPQVTMKFFESEAFNADVTDILVWSAKDLMQYQAIVEGLRETRFWGHYFEIVSILPTIENAFAHHYRDNPITAGMSG